MLLVEPEATSQQEFEFPAQSVVSLAWPAALVICVLLFRDRLRTLLPFLRLRSLQLSLRYVSENLLIVRSVLAAGSCH
jgi:hypothetical protein